MALPNGDLITTPFDPQMAYPSDRRMQVDTLNSRDSMSMFIRWEGMEVYVLENNTKYILQGGRSNEYWKELGTGTGTGGTTFVGQFATAELLPTSGRSAGDYAFVGTGDDFVQYNWDNIANEWVMAEGQTDMASEFFHIGYKTPLRRPVIFPLFPKDVLVQESGDFVFSPETSVARFIFVGEVDAVRGIETAAADREIKLVNRTGSDIPLRDKASGIPSGSGMDFGGSDYTWVNGSEITLKGNGTYLELAPNNSIAFSDHLDSVNAQVSVGSDGVEVITGIYDRYTGNQVQFKEISGSHTADGIIIAFLNGKYFRRTDKEYYIESFGVLGVGNDSLVFQTALDGVAKTESKKLIIDGFELILTTTVSSSADNLIIEFRNGAKISQPAPATNTTWTDQNLRLVLSGNNVTIINLETDGKFNNEGLNSVPSQVRKFVDLTGDNLRLLGRTILKNSGGYNLDTKGENVYAEDIYCENNAYSGFRFFPAKNIEKIKINSFEAFQNFQQNGRTTGMTINGLVDIENIEIGTYIGRNANLFIEAVASDNTFLPYYKNLNIGHYINVFDFENTSSSAIMGKWENLLNANIRVFDNFYRHTSARIQAPQLAQIQNLEIGELNTNVGSWYPARSTTVHSLNYTDEGKTWGNVMFKVDTGGVGRNVTIVRAKTEIPNTPELTGWMQLNSDSRFRMLSPVTSLGNVLPAVVSSAFGVANQFDVDSPLPLGSSIQAFRQSMSFKQKYHLLNAPINLTRDVVRGEIFLFETTDHVKWEVDQPGTCSWSGTTFTGTAIFAKTITNKNYTGTALTNMTNYLTSNDVGMAALIDATYSRWNGSAWVMIPTTSPTNRSGTDITIDRAYVGRFNSFIGPAGNITIPADVFLSGDEIQGQTVGGTKTFIAGSGITLRGSNLVLSTGQRYSIKFRTPTDATLTIYPSTSYSTILSLTDTPSSYTGQKNKTLKVNNAETAVVFVADGVDVRNVTDGGSIAIDLTDGFISSRLNFTSPTAVTLQGVSNANGQSSIILVNPHASNNLTIAHNGSAAVKYISPDTTDFVISPKTAARFEIVGNEMYPLVM